MSAEPSAPRLDTHDALHVVLVEPEIPWNTGNVGRTCLATGATLHLVRPLGFSLDERRLRRAGLDYWRHLEPRIWESWDRFETALPDLGEPFFFTAEAPQDLWSVDYPRPSVLIFGSETTGLAAEIRQRYRRQAVALPMVSGRETGPVRSLNLSTTVGVALYETLRQWRQQP